MMKFNDIFILPAAALMLLSSCVYNEIPDDAALQNGRPQPLVISADIAGNKATRAVTNEIGKDDEWSYVDFSIGDEMGFFSSGGKYSDGNYGEAPFFNQKLIYTGGSGGPNFRDPDNTDFSPTHMNGNEIYMYFPYSPSIAEEGGCELRTYTSPEGEHLDTARCIDFLSTRHLDIMGENPSASAALYGEFQHTFGELIIMRGEGFDKPPKISEDVNEWEIKAVLNTPVTGIQAVVSDENGWQCTPELVFDSSSGLTETEAMEWTAWRGANFYRTQEDLIGQPAWYIIVPTLGCQAKYVAQRPGLRTRVEYIELYDNDGNLQRVSSLLLSNGNSKYVDGGWRYPMEITMKELVPTANPCQIVPWNETVDLTDERKRGINNKTEFEGWINAYNAYLTTDNEQTTNALLKYGDLYVSDDGTKSWHFYVLNDLDLSSYQPMIPVVPVLKDVLDGQSTDYSNGRFKNHTVTGLQTTMIRMLEGENGIIQNFNFESPIVNYGENNTSAVGIIANSMQDGSSVINCQIVNGTLYNPSGPAGMVAGSAVSNATIKDCILSGFLISASTIGNIVGEAENGYINENNNANNVTNQNEDD